MTLRKNDYISGIETPSAPSASDPVNPSDVVTLGYVDAHYVQGTESQADNTAIKALDVSDRTNGDLVFVRSTGYLYQYSSTSVLADDGNYVLQPTSGSGRWIRVSHVDPSTGNTSVPNNIDIGNDVTVHGDIQIDGDVNIDGTLTVINSTTIEVADANLLLNKGGNQATANSNTAGMTIEMSDATDAVIGYDSTLTSKWKAGVSGAESEIITAAGSQTLTGAKTFSSAVTVDPKIDFSEETSVSTPSTGFRGIYATSTGFKQIDSSGIVSDLGGGGGSGSGEINLITDSSTASNWEVTDVDVAVATTTTTSELPLAGIFQTGIKITRSANSASAFYQFTMPSALKNTKLTFKFYQKPLSGYQDGDIRIDVLTNPNSDYSGTYSTISLSSDDSSGITGLPNATGQFTTSFDADDSDYYEIRFQAVAGTTPLVLQNVIIGPGIGATGAVVSQIYDWTPTFTNLGTVTISEAKYMRVGGTVKFWGKATSGTTVNSALTMTIPLGLTAVGNTIVGRLYRNNASLNARKYAVMRTTDASNLLSFSDSEYALDVSPTSGSQTGQNLVGDSTIFMFHGEVAVNEWAGSGTVNLGENDVEYAYNSSTSSTDDTTSFAYGTNGALVQAFAPTGGSAVKKRVRFTTPILATDTLEVEIKVNDRQWVSLGSFGSFQFAYNDAGTTYYGIDFFPPSSTTPEVDVFFFSQRYPGRAWSSESSAGTRWRVKKAKSGVAVGFGLATGDSTGLVKKIKYQQKTLSSNVSGNGTAFLQFNNITVGKTYRYVASVHIEDNNVDSTVAIELVNNGAVQASGVIRNFSHNINGVYHVSIDRVFTAAANTVFLRTAEFATSQLVLAAPSSHTSATYATLYELDGTFEETGDWT